MVEQSDEYECMGQGGVDVPGIAKPERQECVRCDDSGQRSDIPLPFVHRRNELLCSFIREGRAYYLKLVRSGTYSPAILRRMERTGRSSYPRPSRCQAPPILASP